MQPIAVLQPTTTREAVALATRHGRAARFYAGGQDLLYRLKRRLANSPRYLVDLKQIPDQAFVRFTPDDGLRLGPLTRLADLAAAAPVQRFYPALAAAAASIASPQIRNVGTVAGNLAQEVWCSYLLEDYACNMNGGRYCPAAVGDNSGYHGLFGQKLCVAVHPSDLAPALLVLDAEVCVLGSGGERCLAVDELLPGVTRVDGALQVNALRHDELITEIRLPPPTPGLRQVFRKSRPRQSWDFALVSVAAAVQVDAGRCTGARLVLGGVAPGPWRPGAAEAVLVGQALDAATCVRAAAAALDGARPLKDNGFKVPLARALVEQALAELSALG
jgi:xanthine dehydrogenase YagS FAD-binding subunit